jgi:hypothetical protein
VFEGVVGAVLAPILLVLLLLVKAGKLIGADKRRAARHRARQAVHPGAVEDRNGAAQASTRAID